MNPAAEGFWSKFLDQNREIPRDSPFQVWHFGDTPEMALELAELVISGKKSATASLAGVNELKPDEAPILDGYSVVTDFSGSPMCVIQTIEIRQRPFRNVNAQFAWDEGEGDRSLEYWRDVHWRFFTREALKLGIDFYERSIVTCERFKLLFPK
jgi:uncharacterized protein YhfF